MRLRSVLHGVTLANWRERREPVQSMLYDFLHSIASLLLTMSYHVTDQQNRRVTAKKLKLPVPDLIDRTQHPSPSNRISRIVRANLSVKEADDDLEKFMEKVNVVPPRKVPWQRDVFMGYDSYFDPIDVVQVTHCKLLFLVTMRWYASRQFSLTQRSNPTGALESIHEMSFQVHSCRSLILPFLCCSVSLVSSVVSFHIMIPIRGDADDLWRLVLLLRCFEVSSHCNSDLSVRLATIAIVVRIKIQNIRVVADSHWIDITYGTENKSNCKQELTQMPTGLLCHIFFNNSANPSSRVTASYTIPSII